MKNENIANAPIWKQTFSPFLHAKGQQANIMECLAYIHEFFYFVKDQVFFPFLDANDSKLALWSG
jgi:hypothetical protein